MIHFRIYRSAWASPSPRHSPIEFRLKLAIAFLTRPFLCGMSVAPAVAVSIQVVNGNVRDGGDGDARGRGRCRGKGRGNGRGRGPVVQPFRVASALCVTGGNLRTQNMPLSTHTVGNGDTQDTYVRIDLTQRWLQQAVAGKQVHKLPTFCPVLKELRKRYVAAVEGTIVTTKWTRTTRSSMNKRIR